MILEYKVNFVNPLKPSVRCKTLLHDGLRLMNSKMKPQILSFSNSDADYCLNMGAELENVVLMFKRGDDLRQDMLTLQLLKVMDMIWKNAGLDLRDRIQ